MEQLPNTFHAPAYNQMEPFNNSNNTSPFGSGNMKPIAEAGPPQNEQARLNIDLAMAQNPFDQFNAIENQDSTSGAPKSPVPEYISFANNNLEKDSSEHHQSISSKPEGEAFNPPADDSTVASEDVASVTPDVASTPVPQVELKQPVQQPQLAKPDQHYQQQQFHHASPFDSIGVNHNNNAWSQNETPVTPSPQYNSSPSNNMVKQTVQQHGTSPFDGISMDQFSAQKQNETAMVPKNPPVNQGGTPVTPSSHYSSEKGRKYQQEQNWVQSGATTSQMFAQESKQTATMATYQPNVVHGNNHGASQQQYSNPIQVQEQAAPVVSTTQGSPSTPIGGNFNSNLEQQQQQNPIGPVLYNTVSMNHFQAHAQCRMTPVSPSQQYNDPAGSFPNPGSGQITSGNHNIHYQGSAEKQAQPTSSATKWNGPSAHHPTSPASVTQYGAFVETRDGVRAPTTKGVPSPQPIVNSPGRQEDGEYDYFSGPPMGISVLQNSAPSATNTNDGHYKNMINGMNSVAIVPPVQPRKEQYQRPHELQHSPISMGKRNVDQQWQNVYHNPANPSSWQQVNQTQAIQGQFASQSPGSWNPVQQQSNSYNGYVPQYNYQASPVQQQQQLPTKDTARRSPMQQQPYNHMHHTPNGSGHGSSSNLLPNLNHRSQNGETHNRQPWSYETNSHAYSHYDQQGRPHSSPVNSDDCDPSDGTHKRSKDIVREYGARKNALRLLDEATGNHESNRPSQVRSVSLSAGAAQKYGDQQEANKTIQRPLGLLAESSRKIKNFRTWCDPELEEDKCQLDRDRATIAQRRALKMMNKFTD